MNRLSLLCRNHTLLIKNTRYLIYNGNVIHENRRYNHVFTFKYPKRRYNQNFKINNVIFQRLASTSLYDSNEFMLDPAETSKDFSDIPTEILPGTTEPSFEELGLGGESLWGLLQYGLEYLHVDCGLPWWGAVAVATFSLRILVFPFMVMARKNVLRLYQNVKPLEEMERKINTAYLHGNVYESRLYNLELQKFMKDNNISYFKNFVPMIAQGTIFFSFYKALEGMLAVPVESLQTGGLYWFQDLTMPDPYHILPIYSGISLFLMLEFGTEAVKVREINRLTIRYAFRIIPAAVIFFTWNIDSLLLCFWVSNSAFSFLQLYIMKSERFGKILGTTDAKYTKNNPPF